MKISALLSVYHKEKPIYLERALESIYDGQILKPHEIIFVKDGPLSLSLEKVIKKWKEKLGESFKIVSLSKNVGLGGALNEGIKHCRYELVARMDSDDVALSHRFLRQVEAFQSDPSLDIVGSFVYEIDSLGIIGCLRKMPVHHEQIVNKLWACPLLHPTVMFRREKINIAGNYNPALKRRQDYDLWFRCAACGLRFANISEPLMFYHFDRNSLKKQPCRLAFEQALIGYRGTTLLHMALWKRVACFVPFVRSLLPPWMQHHVYQLLQRFDPRWVACGEKR